MKEQELKKENPEEGKPHPYFPGYLFYNDGRVKNVKSETVLNSYRKQVHNPRYGKFIKQHIRGTDKPTVCVQIMNKNKSMTIVALYIIVAELFVENQEGYKYVTFKDGDSLNMHYTNLAWSNSKLSPMEIIKKLEKQFKQ